MMNYFRKAAVYLIEFPKLVRKKISFKLFIIYTITVILPISFFGIFSYIWTSSAVRNDFIKDRKYANVQIMMNIEKNINDLNKQAYTLFNIQDDLITYITAKPEEMFDDKIIETKDRLNNYFYTLLPSSKNLYGISLIDMNGNVKYYISTLMNDSTLLPVNSEQWFKDTLKNKGQPLFQEPRANKFYFNSKYTNEPKVISVSSTLQTYDDFEHPYGVIVLFQSLDQFYNSAVTTNRLNEETLLIVNQKGEVIFSSDSKITKLPDEENKILFSSKQGTFIMELSGESMLNCYTTSSNLGWKIISSIPVSELRKRSQFVKRITAIQISIVTIFILFISVLVSNMITSPLRKLKASFIKLESGDFNTKVTISGKDELSEISVSFNKMVANIKKLIKQEYEANILRKQAELEVLQSQINPHFLYNTLNSIKIVAEKQEYQKVCLMIQSLSDIFRYTLNKGSNKVSFSEELVGIKKYLYLQESRFSDKIKIHYDIAKDVLEYPILRLTLQPIIENALYHGLDNKIDKGEIYITAQALADKFYIYISNNGAHIPEEELVKINSCLSNNSEILKGNHSKSVGMYNVNSRIKYYFGNEYGLRIYSMQGENTTVKITLPAKKIIEIIEGD